MASITPPNKNIARLAQALAGLEVRLRIIGKPSIKDEEILMQYKIRYSWTSHLSEEGLIQEYVQSDMLVFVSTLEGFGMPIVEAQSIGRPVVTSAVSAMPEVTGDGACLVDPFNVSAIRQGIKQVLSETQYKEALVQKGFENVKKYQVANVAQQYYKLYQEIYSDNVRRK